MKPGGAGGGAHWPRVGIELIEHGLDAKVCECGHDSWSALDNALPDPDHQLISPSKSDLVDP